MDFSYIQDDRWKDFDEATQNEIISLAFDNEIKQDSRWASLEKADQAEVKQIYTQQAQDESFAMQQMIADEEPESTVATDYTRSLAAGLNRFGQTIGRGIDVVGNIDPTRLVTDSGEGVLDTLGQGIEKYYKGQEQEDLDALSPAMQEAKKLRYTTDVEESWREAPLKNFASIFQGDAWKSPAKIVGSLAESAPSTAVGMGTGAAFTNGLIKLGVSSGLSGVIGGFLGEGSTASVESGKEIYDMVLTAPQEIISSTPEYQKAWEALVDENLSPSERDRQTRELVADHAAIKSMATVFAATGLLGSVSGHYMGKLIGGEASGGLTRRALTSGGLETLQETPQSGYEVLEKNMQTKKYVNPNQDLWEGVKEGSTAGGVQGFAMGLGMGGGVAALGRPQVDPTKPPVAVQEATTTDDAIAAAETELDQALELILPGETPPVVDLMDGRPDLLGAEAEQFESMLQEEMARNPIVRTPEVARPPVDTDGFQGTVNQDPRVVPQVTPRVPVQGANQDQVVPINPAVVPLTEPGQAVGESEGLVLPPVETTPDVPIIPETKLPQPVEPTTESEVIAPEVIDPPVVEPVEAVTPVTPEPSDAEVVAEEIEFSRQQTIRLEGKLAINRVKQKTANQEDLNQLKVDEENLLDQIEAHKPVEVPLDPKIQTLVDDLNQTFPGYDIKYDALKGKAPEGKAPKYSFTPQSGELEGKSFAMTTLDPEVIKARVRSMKLETPVTPIVQPIEPTPVEPIPKKVKLAFDNAPAATGDLFEFERKDIYNLLKGRKDKLQGLKNPNEKAKVQLKRVLERQKSIQAGTVTDKELTAWGEEIEKEVLLAQIEISKSKVKPQFQVGERAPGEGVSLEDIQSDFKGQKIFIGKDNEISVVLDNGQGITITKVKDFENGDIELAINSGQMGPEGIIFGSTEKNKIKISKDFAENIDLLHEIKHALSNMGVLTAKDDQTLLLELNKLSQAGKLRYDRSTMTDKDAARKEDLANVWAQVLDDRKKYRGTKIGKIIQKVMDFLDGLRAVVTQKQTMGKLAREFESGKMFGRKATKKVGTVERITLAATKHPETGKIFTGVHHGESMEKSGIPFDSDFLRSPVGEADNVNGFVTNTGRFVTREEALEVARKAKQVDSKVEAPGMKKLAQEDLDAYEMFSESSNAFSAAEPAPKWYSALVKGVEGIKQKIAPASQWKAMISKLPVKAEELSWVEVNEWLDEQTGKVSKQDLIDFIGANNVMLEEVTLDDGNFITKEESRELHNLNSMKRFDEELTTEQVKRMNKLNIKMRMAQAAKSTKHSAYVEPGGEDYKELLLTIPQKQTSMNADAQRIFGKDFIDLNREQVKMMKSELDDPKDVYKSGHYSEPNIVAHVRFNSRTDAEGNKVLFLEEVQSDWHQAGRKEGYQRTPEEIKKVKRLNELTDKIDNQIAIYRDANSEQSLTQTLIQLRKEESFSSDYAERGELRQTLLSGVPDAPFKKSWPLLTLKRMVRYAAENGFDKIAWTTGEQQAARYDLSKQVDNIQYANGRLIAYGDGDLTLINENVEEDKLEDYIGKDIAKKLIEQEETNRSGIWAKRLSNTDLKVGGEGMKAFYDKMLPSMAKKFFKKFGGRIETTDLRMINPSMEAALPASARGEGVVPKTVMSMTITPQMKVAAVKTGMPMFQTSEGKINSQPFEVDDESTRRETAYHAFVDVLAPVSKVQKAIERDTGKEIQEKADYLLSERLRRNKTGAQIKADKETLVQPMVDLMAKNDFDVTDVGEAAYGRHAIEANKRLQLTNARRFLLDLAETNEKDYLKEKIDAIDEVMKELDLPNAVTQRAYLDLLRKELQYTVSKDTKAIKQDWLDKKDRFSGITDIEAKKINADWADDADMQSILKMIDKVTAATLDVSLDSGRITQAEYDAFKSTFKHYVPLYREGHKSQSGLFGTGQGIVNLGKDYKIRGGSTKRAVNVLENVLVQHERAIERAGKAESGRTLLQLIKDFPNKKFWSISEKAMVNAYDSNGNIYKKEDFKIKDNQVPLKIDGKYYIITMNSENEHAMRIVNHLKGNNANTGAIVRGLSKLNRYFATIHTGLNPEFILTNLPRDVQIAAVNLSSTELKDMTMKVMKDIPAAAMGLRDAIRGTGTSDWGKTAKEFEAAGGKMAWADRGQEVEKLAKSINSEVWSAQGKALPMTWKTIKKVGKLIEDYNSIAENATRLAAYKNARNVGLSKAKAALLAKELTVNFEQKGLYGELYNSLYLFSSAGVQGSARLISGLVKSSKARKIVGGMMISAIGVTVANGLLGGDDDEGKNKYAQVKDHEKERNMIFIIPNSGGKVLKIPLGWGLNFFWNIGTEIGDAILAGGDPSQFKYDPMEGASRLLNAGLNAFNPIQSATFAQMISPTITDPVVQIAENKNFFGAPIMPEKNKFEDVPTPESQRYWKSVRPSSKAMAEFLNNISGGDKVEKGLVDISPEIIDLVEDTFTGGLGRFVSGVVGLPQALSEDPVDIRKVPLARKFIGGLDKTKGRQDFYANAEEVKMLLKKIKTYPERRREFMKDPRFRLTETLKSTERQINALRKIIKRARSENSKKRLNDRIKKLQNKFNERFEKRIKK